MADSALRKQIYDYIDSMSERNLRALKPLLSVLAETPLYTVETDLSAEEIALIDEGMKEYRENPERFVPLENLKA